MNAASGRAVMAWFGPGERGLAMSIRQTAVPLGGLLGACVLPSLARQQGFSLVFGLLAGLACAFAYACNSRNESSVVASASIDFLKAAQVGDRLTAVASERAVSGHSGFYEVSVTNQDGDRTALYHGRAHRLKEQKIIRIERDM